MERCSYTHEELAADMKAESANPDAFINPEYVDNLNKEIVALCEIADKQRAALEEARSGSLPVRSHDPEIPESSSETGAKQLGAEVSSETSFDDSATPEPAPELVVPFVEPVADTTAPVDPVAWPAVEAPAEGAQP